MVQLQQNRVQQVQQPAILGHNSLAPVSQLAEERVSEARCWRFDSARGHQIYRGVNGSYWVRIPTDPPTMGLGWSWHARPLESSILSRPTNFISSQAIAVILGSVIT